MRSPGWKSWLPTITFGVLLTACSSTGNERLPKFIPQTARVDLDEGDPEKGLELHVLDLGQADSLIVLGPGAPGSRKSLLIDAGETSIRSRKFELVAEKLKVLLGDEPTVDYFVASHFHNDHVGSTENGIAGLLASGIRFGTVIDIHNEAAEYFNEARRSTYDNYVATMAEHVGAEIDLREKPEFGPGQIDLGPGVEVHILTFGGRVAAADTGVLHAVDELYPDRYESAPPSENDLSIGLKIEYGPFEFFTAGDLTGAEDSWGGTRLYTPRSYSGDNSQTYTNVESWMVNYWDEQERVHDVEVYRANHHGSHHSSTPELIEHLDPEFVIYSCGGKYGHPTKPVAERISETARQFVTSSLSSRTWSNAGSFAALNGQVVADDIVIYVEPSGEWYWINDEVHRSFGNAEEAAGADIDEEHTEWIFEED